MMGDSKLCLLLLLSTSALAFAQDEDQPTCLLAKRYKTLHKYEYQYEAGSMNAINGASPLKNGPKTSCTVELEVPQTCRFIIRTTGCSLSELVDTDAEGNPVFAPAPTSKVFAAEMEKYPLKFVVDGVDDVELYPEDGETTTILNIKRGIISALAVPLLEEDKNKMMPTIHGKCKTYYQVNAREEIATDITLNRDLSRCDRFVPLGDYTSPLALISGMHYPLAQLVRSSQTCNYKFDNDKKHMTSGSCTENHILIPFSHKGKYGVTNVGKQEITLVQVSAHNDRVFEHSNTVKALHMEAVEDKSVVQDKDAVLNLLRELATLPEREGEKRANLFQKLVTMVRGMKAPTLSQAIPEALAVSHVLTYQVLAQCGTPECSSAIMQILRTFDSSQFKIDATVFAMGLISNPSALLINDMLKMAEQKPSKSVLYALSNVVKRFYKGGGKLIPEIHAVAEFMAARLGDCSGDSDNTFMTLRVVGNMAPAVVPASPALRAAVIRCVNQPAASLAVQQAAIQVYRLTPVPKEDREVLVKVLLDSTNPVQKRIAAYLVLMKDPQLSELVRLIDDLSNEQDTQVKSFIMSHIINILSSTEPETQGLRQNIREALQGNKIGPIMEDNIFSRNYKIGSVEGNMIFEGTSYLPREAMLEMTLKAFGYDIDMIEIGMEGKGFEPMVDTLFGENGFFPDTALKTMYFVSDNMPPGITEILNNVVPALKKNRMKRQASQNLIKEIGHNLNKVVTELKASQSPEAMVYLKLLGNELGYLKTSEVQDIANSAAMMIESMIKMFPTDLMAALMTKTDNTIFAHYIFMDNEFFLPTVTGVPLKIALLGTFTPGFKGGLKIARDMSEVTFMPSAGVEFLTHFGSYIPEYVNSALEMHTNIFHESGLNAKISVTRDQVKLTIPAPTSPTKLIKITNTLEAVTTSEVKTIPTTVMDKIDVSKCTPGFAGINYCTALQYTDASSQETSPYFPLTGDSKFAVELHPTGEVTEYTAMVAYELLREGEEGRQKVDSVKFILRSEGAEPTEARAIFKYNRRKHVVTADIQIPDYDVEAGLRLSAVDGDTKGKGTHSISLDFINKNIPQLSLVGRANLKAMKDGMLQGQLLVPSINVDATVTANMKRDRELALGLKSEIKFMDSTSEQKMGLIYDGEKIVVAIKSDVKSSFLPSVFGRYCNELLNKKVGQTDMKVRHIFEKFAEATNNYMAKHSASVPYLIRNFRVPDVPEISLPETLFLTTEAKAAYTFNNEHFTIAIPLPLGEKSTEVFNFPAFLTIPGISLPQFGLDIDSMQIPIPEFVIPESLILSIPLFGKAEASTFLKSNLYNMEASMAVGKDISETPSYSAMFDVEGMTPNNVLLVKFQGLGNLAITDSITAQLKSSFANDFIEVSFSIDEEATIKDKIYLKSSSKFEVQSSFGVNLALEHSGMTGINTNEISADNNFKGTFDIGPMLARTISNQTFTFFPFRPQAKFDSIFQFDSRVVKAHNTVAATLANGEISVVSNTKVSDEILKHVAELSFKNRKLLLKCEARALALGMKIHNQAEASADARSVTMRIGTVAEHFENYAHSLLTASLDANGLGINSNATLKLFENEATHKATLRINEDGLTTRGENTLQSPLSLENTFNVGADFSKATLSISNKAALTDIVVKNDNILTITFSSLDFNSQCEATASEHASYTHDITIGLKPYFVSADVNNNVKLLAANFINEAKLKAELCNIDLTGSLKTTYGPDEIKHTYHVNYADMTATAKFSTTGNVYGMQMNHNTDLEVAGLAVVFTNVARINSQPVRFDHSIRCSVVPFDINFDAIFNADGDVTMYGKNSGQLYGKFLFKAQPLAFTSVHEYRGSVTNTLDNGFELETTFDNKMDTVLSLQEQRSSFKMTSKMNEHSFNQGISIYNIAERTGIEVSSTILTNIFNTDSTENQEFTVSGFFKYDKNTDSHIIQFPLTGNVLGLLESMKGFVVVIAETLQQYIESYELKASLEDLFQEITGLISKLDVEDLVIQLMQYFNDFMQEPISVEDLETSLRNLEEAINNMLFVAIFGTWHLQNKLDEIFPISTVVSEIEEQLHALDKKFGITDFISTVFRVITPCLEELYELSFEDIFSDPVNYTMKVLTDLDIPSKINILRVKIRELIVKIESDRHIQAVLKRSVMLIKQLRIEETIRDVVKIVTDANIPTKLMQDFKSAINDLKSTEVKDIIQGLNVFIENINQQLNLLNYNNFVDYTNWLVSEGTAYLNNLMRTYEISKKIKATTNFINFVLSSVRDFTENLRETRLGEIIALVQDIIYEAMVGSIKGYAKFIKKRIENLNVEDAIKSYLNIVSKCLINVMDDIEIPTQLDIPEFSILGIYTVKPTTISFDDIKQRIVELMDFIVNSDIKMLDVDAFLGDLKMNYLPPIPEITFPEISIAEISLPAIPKLPVEKLVNSLKLPEIKLPTIANEVIFPCFGKFYGEFKFLTPIYTIKLSAEFKNSTETKMTPNFSGLLISQGTSPHYEILNYKLDTTTRIAIPKMSRVVLAETIKFNHQALGLDHRASLTLYGLSAQAQAKTTVKVTTTPYTANIVNIADIAVEEGVSASFNTKYTHLVDLPSINVRSEATVNQNSIARHDGLTFTLTADNSEPFHKSNLVLSVTPSTVKLTFSGDTDSTILKLKQQITAESSTLNYFKFNVRNEAEAPVIKKSLLVVSGHGNLYDMKAELKANHETELHGEVSGTLSNAMNFVVRPVELVYKFQNRGNVMFDIFNSLTAKIDLQNDYSVFLRPDSQQVATVALARLNEYKIFYNVTLNNNEKEAGVSVAMESAANLDFLKIPISIPEIDLPFFNTNTPAINDVNLYDHTGLNLILTTTEQTVNGDALIVYQKSQAAPLVDVMGLVQIPYLGNLITELSFKSAIINLNANAGIYTEDNLVFRLGATTVSVYDALKSTLHGTTSLTTRRGIKLASSLSLENNHFEGSHNSTISITPETETAVSVVTVAKIALPVFNLETKQNLVVDTKTKANAISSLTMKGDLYIPTIRSVVKGAADHNLKLEGTLDYISMESATRANMDGTGLSTDGTDYRVLGVLDNEINVYLNKDGLRSTSKVNADGKINHGTNENDRVIWMDVNGSLGLQFSGRDPSQMSARVYGRYPSALEDDVDILVIRSFYDQKDADKMNLQIVYNMEPFEVMLSELKIRLHFILRFVDEFIADLIHPNASVLDETINEIIAQAQVYFTLLVDNFRSITFYTPDGEEITGHQILGLFAYAYTHIAYNVLALCIEISEIVGVVLREVSEVIKPFISVSEGMLKINLAFPFQH